MTYTQLIEELFSKRRRLVPKALQLIKVAAQSLGNPQQNYPTIHIAGTNGKGSVTTKIAKTLEYAGYRVGLFTSPHIDHFGERMQINGAPISEEDIVRLLPPLMERFPGFCFFDYATLLAFQYFDENRVDAAVFETGIGGLHDTTNVIVPLVSIITSVGLDHQEYLGETLDEIAFQKAGIIKPGVPVVIGPKAHLKPIYDQAKALNSPLIQVLVETGSYDMENQAIARAAIQQISHEFFIPEEAIEKGLLARPPCRFERHGRFVLDVAHNVEGFQSLLKTWDYHHPGKKFTAIVGLSSDKDLEGCLTLLANRAEHLFLIAADSKRATSLEHLEEVLKRRNISNYTACPSIAQGIEQALDLALAGKHDILVCGSFYIMKQVREQVFRCQVS
ncbi:MAG: bifunctional folylpolyglutamate synthase/dihydrofolate synthase [Rhabdochlamydiaceae bacterium]|jgi:dihydrofolate synthase/folylpolyglutamate synthase